MKTYEMVKLADENGKTYIAGSMRYRKTKGFHQSDGGVWPASAFGEYGLNDFIHTDNWKEMQPKEMTLEEIEKMLGYEVKIVKGEK